MSSWIQWSKQYDQNVIWGLGFLSARIFLQWGCWILWINQDFLISAILGPYFTILSWIIGIEYQLKFENLFKIFEQLHSSAILSYKYWLNDNCACQLGYNWNIYGDFEMMVLPVFIHHNDPTFNNIDILWVTWHDMETLSGYCPFVRGIHWSTMDSPHKGTVMQSFDVYFVNSLWRLVKKQSSCWWFEMASHSYDEDIQFYWVTWWEAWQHSCVYSKQLSEDLIFILTNNVGTTQNSRFNNILKNLVAWQAA